MEGGAGRPAKDSLNHPFISRNAEREIRSIWDYIARDSVKHANLVVEAIVATAYKLQDSPMIGHLRSDLTRRDVRFAPVSRYPVYLLAYTKSKKGIRVLHVLHGAQDIPKYFSS